MKYNDTKKDNSFVLHYIGCFEERLFRALSLFRPCVSRIQAGNDSTIVCLKTLGVLVKYSVHVNISKFWFTVRFGKEMTSFTIFSMARDRDTR